MIYTIYAPQSIKENINLPASKSISNRVLLLNALSERPQPICNLSESDDTQVLKSILESETSTDAEYTVFNVGAAGTAMRFLTAYLAQLPGKYILTGSERMKNRPIKILVEALRNIGANIEYTEKDGFPPLRIHGQKLPGGSVQLPGNVSSQYISALMMIAPCMTNGLSIRLEGKIASEPYIRMTESLMRLFGAEIIREENLLQIKPQSYQPVPFTVENDWSAASYMYEIAALAEKEASIILNGLSEDSLQGDSEVRVLFEQLGVKSVFKELKDFKELKVLKEESMTAPFAASSFNNDFTDQPDLAQTFMATYCLLNIPFRFSGLHSLRIKETDRIHAMQTELKKLGYVLNLEENDVVSWTGECCPEEENAIIATYQDHRMAMAFAPVALIKGSIKIANPEVVSKSYPGFWEDLKSLGFTIHADESVIAGLTRNLK